LSAPLPRSALLLLRLAVAAGLLALAFRVALPADHPGLARALLESWHTSLPEALAWFGLAWALLGLSLVVGALRFRVLLRGAGLTMSFGALLRAYLVATYFNLVLPGAVLGDVYRFLDARRGTGRGSTVLGMVAVERLLSLSALGSIGLVVVPAIPLASEDRWLAGALIFLSGSFAAGTAFALHPRTNPLLRRLVAPMRKLSERLADGIDRALVAVAEVSKKPAVLGRTFALSLANQGLPVLALCALAVPLDALVAWYWFAIIVPFVTLVSLLPISIGGTGVREYLYVALFGAVGMRPESALALSLSVLAAALLWGLVGFAIFAVGRRDHRHFAAEPPPASIEHGA